MKRRKNKKPRLLLMLLLIVGLSAVFLFFNGPVWIASIVSKDSTSQNEVHEDDLHERQLEEAKQSAGLDNQNDILTGEDEKEFSSEGEETTEGANGDPDKDLTEKSYTVIEDGDYLLALVTKETTLRSDYEPADLEPIPAYMNPSYNMKLRALPLEMLKALWRWAESDGVILSIRSAYRSYGTQERLFQDYANRHGEEEANRFSARPGQSEHQLGTTVDFGGTDFDFKAQFAQTNQGIWLADNAHRFGFAMSYPEGKEHITGYIFEPWHFRFIGVDEALEWKKSGKTLNQYLASKEQNYE